ncbi:hypothetical protein ACJX0J_020553, partial [Zea mays]
RMVGFGKLPKYHQDPTTKEDWILPSRQPDRTTVYKNRALRMPFVKMIMWCKILSPSSLMTHITN